MKTIYTVVTYFHGLAIEERRFRTEPEADAYYRSVHYMKLPRGISHKKRKIEVKEPKPTPKVEFKEEDIIWPRL